MKNIIQERAYMALQITMSQPVEPRNQWHSRVLESANSEPKSEKLWPLSPESTELADIPFTFSDVV